MKYIKITTTLLYLFMQPILGCSEAKKESTDPIKCRGRGRAGSFLESFDEKSSSQSKTSFIYRSPRPSQKSTFAAYNALLEDRLQPSESQFDSFEHEIASLQKCWDTYHQRYLSTELADHMGKHAVLLLDVKHIFKPIVRNQDSDFPKMHGFHHDPEKILEKSGLLKIQSKKNYLDLCYKQKILTQTDPEVWAKKTFFPETWSRKETLRAVLIALQNSKKCADEDDMNKEFEGTAPTKPPVCMTIRIKFLPDKAFITTVHPKH